LKLTLWIGHAINAIQPFSVVIKPLIDLLHEKECNIRTLADMATMERIRGMSSVLLYLLPVYFASCIISTNCAVSESSAVLQEIENLLQNELMESVGRIQETLDLMRTEVAGAVVGRHRVSSEGTCRSSHLMDTIRCLCTGSTVICLELVNGS
jgi:hypothetical protein